MSVDQLKSLMQKHDWFFEYSDDIKIWRKGNMERQQIISMLHSLPIDEAKKYFALAPEELRVRLIYQFNLTVSVSSNSHPPHEQDEAW